MNDKNNIEEHNKQAVVNYKNDTAGVVQGWILSVIGFVYLLYDLFFNQKHIKDSVGTPLLIIGIVGVLLHGLSAYNNRDRHKIIKR